MLEVRRGASVRLQVEHPGIAIPDPLHGVIQWRLLFPVIGHVLHLPPPVLRAGIIAALLLPAHHVMSDAVNPVFYL